MQKQQDVQSAYCFTKNHNQRSMADWIADPWLACQQSYVYFLLQIPLTLSLLTYLRGSSALATEHPDVTAFLPPFPSLGPTLNQPQTPGSHQNSISFPSPSDWNILPLFSELTASLPARLSSTVPPPGNTFFFPLGTHTTLSWLLCLHTCLYPSFTKSLWGVQILILTSAIQTFPSSHRSQ